LYERLEQCIRDGETDKSELEKIMNALNIRMGSFGVERKNIVNNLFKNIIEMSVPNFVKYLFWGSITNSGIFNDEGLTQE